jgi:heat shock protein HslJ
MSARFRLTVAAVGLLAVLTVAACTTTDGRSEASGLSYTPALSDLHGHAWVADSIVDPHRNLVPGSTITMTFTKDSLSANAGCNTMFGAAAIDGTKLVAHQLASTQKACDQRLAAQDIWLAAFLGSRPTIEWLDHDLWLSHKDTVLHFTDEDA